MTKQPQSSPEEETSSGAPSSRSATLVKCLVAGVLLLSAVATYTSHNNQSAEADATPMHHRRLSMVGSTVPTYVEGLMTDLKERKKLFDETPPEEVKYWFEYTGPLQVRCVLTDRRANTMSEFIMDHFVNSL